MTWELHFFLHCEAGNFAMWLHAACCLWLCVDVGVWRTVVGVGPVDGAWVVDRGCGSWMWSVECGVSVSIIYNLYNTNIISFINISSIQRRRPIEQRAKATCNVQHEAQCNAVQHAAHPMIKDSQGQSQIQIHDAAVKIQIQMQMQIPISRCERERERECERERERACECECERECDCECE